MKNKKATYLLVFSVIVIWGIIIYRIFSHVYGTDAPNVAPVALSVDSTFTFVDSSYKLKLNYKDPFLKGGYVPVSNSNKTVNNNSKPGIRRRINQSAQPTVKQTVVWPEIQFSGIILNDKSTEELGLVNINNASYLFREGESRKEILLIKLYADSIQVRYKEEIKTIKKL